MRKTFTAISICALLSACAWRSGDCTHFTMAEAPTDAAVVHVFRSPAPLLRGGIEPFLVFANGVPFAQLGPAEYFTYITREGTVRFTGHYVGRFFAGTSNRGQELLLLDVEPGQHYFYRLRFGFADHQLVPVPPTEALAALRECTRAYLYGR